MKKVLAIAFIGILAVSCSKKETSTESNVMLEEPKVEVVDSASAAKPATPTTTPTPTPTPAKTDSATVKK